MTSMTDTSSNPYAAPNADLATDESGSEITTFDRFSAWGVFGLTVITFGLYYIYWLYSRTKRLNLVVDNKISDAFVGATMVCYVLYIALSAATPFLGEAVSSLNAAIGVLGILSTVLPIVWLFKVRNRINQITNSEKGDATRCGPVLTFFFSCIYLQYKINQNLDALSGDSK